MKRKTPRDIKTIILLFAAVSWFGLALHAMVGCMTVEGFGADVQAAARGIRNADK